MIVREKDREISSFISTIHLLKKENQKYKSKNVQKEDVRTLEDLMLKLNKSEKENDELKSEVSALKRIQNQQSRALSQMVYKNDYP